jgi:hypothetical protein
MSSRPQRPLSSLAAVVALALAGPLLAGCGAGPYSHSPRYVELSDETAAVAGAREYDPVMVQRQPDAWRKGNVMLFGVVDSRTPGPGGQAMLKLGVRRLVTLRGGDDVGPKAVGQRSLVRLVGTIGQDVSPSDGAPVLHATYYRHWPMYYYVTRASAVNMKQ